MPNKPASPCTYCGQPATNNGRCPRHQRPTTTTQRGYGPDHKRRRAAETLAVQQGRAYCWRCIANGTPKEQALINPNEPWHLGHDDTDRRIYRGPEHQRCNTAAAARRNQHPRGWWQ